jgi:hypothetical protein
MYFVDHNRLTGDYIIIDFDVELRNFNQSFLIANTVVPQPPSLPLIPESIEDTTPPTPNTVNTPSSTPFNTPNSTPIMRPVPVQDGSQVSSAFALVNSAVFIIFVYGFF